MLTDRCEASKAAISCWQVCATRYLAGSAAAAATHTICSVPQLHWTELWAGVPSCQAPTHSRYKGLCTLHFSPVA